MLFCPWKLKEMPVNVSLFWIPKYRHQVSTEPYRSTMRTIFQKVGYDYDIDIIELEISEDYIHMVIRRIPKQSSSDVMQIIKSITAREFFRIYPEIKKKNFRAVNYGLNVFLLKLLGMLPKKSFENMYKTN